METLGSTDHASGAADPRRPRLSVIVPVRDGASFLAESLPALRASDLPGEAWELVLDTGADPSTKRRGRGGSYGARRTVTARSFVILRHD